MMPMFPPFIANPAMAMPGGKVEPGQAMPFAPFQMLPPFWGQFPPTSMPEGSAPPAGMMMPPFFNMAGMMPPPAANMANPFMATYGYDATEKDAKLAAKDGKADGAPDPNQSKSERRKEAYQKFRAKKKNLNFNKTIRYASRKHLAEARPRIRGQFVKCDPKEKKGSSSGKATSSKK